MRTPLNVLLGYVIIVKVMIVNWITKTREYAILRRNGKHLSDLLEGLLEISKIEAGRLELQRVEFNRQPCSNELAEMFAMEASQKGLEFKYIPCT